MRPTTAAADTIRTLIAAVPDDRLREIFLDLALAALAVPAVEEPKPAARNGRPPRARGQARSRGKGWRHGKGKHKIDRRRRAYLDALNAKRREQRHLAREAAGEAAGAVRKKPGPKLKPKTNGTQPHGNGATTAAALWEHARKLDPRTPWRAVSRELGISEGAAQAALRNLTVPENVSPAAVARFLTLR
jgi:hypothetical protein